MIKSAVWNCEQLVQLYECALLFTDLQRVSNPIQPVLYHSFFENTIFFDKYRFFSVSRDFTTNTTLFFIVQPFFVLSESGNTKNRPIYSTARAACSMQLFGWQIRRPGAWWCESCDQIRSCLFLINIAGLLFASVQCSWTAGLLTNKNFSIVYHYHLPVPPYQPKQYEEITRL